MDGRGSGLGRRGSATDRLRRLRRREPGDATGASASTSGDWAPNSLGIPGYEDAEPVGRGGFATVYRARQIAFDRTVAIKVFSAPGVDPDTRRRFERECRALGKVCDHPNIVAVYDSGITQAGWPYITMSYVTGGSLADRMAGRGPMLWYQAIEIGIKLAGALETAHRAGVLHRDIKPENVLFSAYGEPELADFGAATIQKGSVTYSGVITASLPYTPPEILDGQPASEAADVYALGSTIYTLLAGRPAFVRSQQEHVHALLSRIVSDPIPDLRPNGVPASIWAVLERAMDKRPEGRQLGAAEFGMQLQQAQTELGMPTTEMRLAVSDDAGTDTRVETVTAEPVEEADTAVVPDVGPPLEYGPPLESGPPVQVGPPVDEAPIADDSRTVIRERPLRPHSRDDQDDGKTARSRRVPLIAAAVVGGLLLVVGMVMAFMVLTGPSGGKGADLAVSTTQPRYTGELGKELTYELVVANAGPADATDVTVTVTLPRGITFKGARLPSCSANEAVVTCRLGRLAKKATMRLPITVVPQVRIGTHSATVFAKQADPRGANGTATVNILVPRCVRDQTSTTLCY
jgi:uncharacterized repeat protein (TIGR01451 family)